MRLQLIPDNFILMMKQHKHLLISNIDPYDICYLKIAFNTVLCIKGCNQVHVMYEGVEKVTQIFKYCACV